MQSLSEVHGGSEWDNNPVLYLQTIGAYKEEIARGRAALEASGANAIDFYYVGAPEGDGFVEPISKYDATKDCPEVCTYTYNEGEEPTPHCYAPEDFYEITWQGPHLHVTPYDATLTWDAKHGVEEIRVDVNEAEI